MSYDCKPDSWYDPPDVEVCPGCAEAGKGLECSYNYPHCADCGIAGEPEDQIEKHNEVFCDQDCLDEFEFSLMVKEAS